MEPLRVTPRIPIEVEPPLTPDEVSAPPGAGPSEPDSDALTPSIIHDLREPLRSIRFVTGFLREDRPDMDEATARAMARIDDLANRADRLMNALAEHTRLGQQDLRPAAIDLNELVAEVIWNLERQKISAPGEAALVSPLPWASCDRAMIGRAITELVSNGLIFNRSSPRRVELGATPGEPGTVFVRDNGIGIDPRRLPDVFRMFARLHPRDEFGGGVGAGLPIARRIIERHAGKIWATSRPGAGSTFFFMLPPA